MILSDKIIEEQIKNGILLVADNGEALSSPIVKNISYDLSTKSFFSKELGDKGATEYLLQPLDSVFVASSEQINLPNNVSAQVKLKYGLMTDGLMLDAPLYQPGHHGSNIFFRLTNISNKEIKLTTGSDYAYIMFYETEKVDEPYNGKFCNSQTSITEIREHSYKGIYPDIKNDIHQTRAKFNNAEKTIYGNVLVIITVFITLFSLLSSFFGSTNGNATLQPETIFLILGCIFSLVGAVCIAIGNDKSIIWKVVALWIIAAAFFWMSYSNFYRSAESAVQPSSSNCEQCTQTQPNSPPLIDETS